jgi:uncharacterized protein (DUF1697 family)
MTVSPYAVLLRGINVGGKNVIPMAELKALLDQLGFANVATYIASGNVILESKLPPGVVKARIETALRERGGAAGEAIKVLVLTRDQLQAVIGRKPDGFGDRPDTYHSDVVFLIDLAADQAISVFSPREGVDTVWPGPGVVYSQRLSAERTKSRLNKIMASPLYKAMTIRNWNTTVRLMRMMDKRAPREDG